MGVEDWGAPDDDGRLFVARQVSYGRPIEPGTTVYIDRIDDVVRRLGTLCGV